MTNLKRVLSLALAAVMLMGMMVIGAGAANVEYTDAESIENAEAVTVLTALDVLGGYPDGSFKPEGNITRAEAAAVICRIMLGADVAESLSTATAPFADVKATNWAAGYIAYLKNLGVISGIGNNKFNPQGNVTVGEFAKMLLGAAGIDGQFTGSSWLINVSVAAQKANILSNKDVVTNAATRDAVAGYTLNTLFYTENGKQDGYYFKGDSNYSDIVFATQSDAFIFKALVADTTPVDGTLTPHYDTTGSLADTVFHVVRNTQGSDEYKAPATVYSNVAGYNTLSEALTFAKKATLSYTTAVTGGNLYTALGLKTGVTYTVNYYVDGKTESTFDASKLVSGNTDPVGGKGTLTNVYMTGTTIDIVVLNTYVDTIASYTPAVTNADGQVTTKAKVTLTTGTAIASRDFETTTFTKDNVGDTVLYTKCWNGSGYDLKTVEVATSATVVPTRVNGTTSFVANGTTYEFAANGGASIAGTAVTNKDQVVIYFDNYGYVIKTGTPDNTTTTNYAYVINAATDKTDIWSSAKNMAQLLLTDGTVVTVELTSDSEFGTQGADIKGKLVTYTVSNGKYELENATDLAAAASNTALSITKGVAAGKVDSKAVYFSAKTIFVVISGTAEAPVYNVYTGINNVPSMEGTTSATAIAMKGTTKAAANDIADVVVVKGASNAASSTSDNYFVLYDATVTKTTDVDLGEYYEYVAVVNGTITTVKVSETAKTAMSSANKFVQSVTMNDKGVITGFGADVTTSPAIGTKALKDGLLGLGTGYVTCASDCAVYMIKDGKISISAVSAIADDANDTVVYTVKDGVVTSIYITVVA